MIILNERFVKSCVRDPNQKFIERQYIESIYNSVTYIFAPWINGKLNISFREMLKQQHKITVGNNYPGYTNPVDIIPSSVIRDEKNIQLQKPTLKKEWYKEELKNYKIPKDKILIPRVNGIPVEMSHKIEFVDDGLKLHLPIAKYVKYYIITMEEIMNKIKKNLNKPPINLLDLLGHYIQLGVVCHPFEKVNFSLIMSQVNYILMYCEYSPISHGYLDFECFFNSTDEIIKSFKLKVKEAVNV